MKILYVFLISFMGTSYVFAANNSNQLEIQLKKQAYVVLAEGIDFEQAKNSLSTEEYNLFLACSKSIPSAKTT